MTLSRTRSWVLALVVGFLGLAIVGGGALSVPVAAEGGDDLSLSPQVRGLSNLGDILIPDNNDPPVISDNPPVHSKSLSVRNVDQRNVGGFAFGAQQQGTGSSDPSCDDSSRHDPSRPGFLLPPCIEVRLAGESGTTKVSWLTTDRTTLHDYFRFECQRLGYGDVGSCANEKLRQRQQLCNDTWVVNGVVHTGVRPGNERECPANANWR